MQCDREAWSEQQKAFYVSVAWIGCARAYRKNHPLCERCLERNDISAAEEVHHKIKLSPENINNPDITLNWDNLEALCGKCHKEEHSRQRSEGRKKNRRWQINDNGDIILRDSPLGA